MIEKPAAMRGHTRCAVTGFFANFASHRSPRNDAYKDLGKTFYDMAIKPVDKRCATVLDFLKKIAVNNDRDWFKANRALYDEASEAFRDITAGLIARIAEFEPEVERLSPSDCTYRIYRDIRFSTTSARLKSTWAHTSIPTARNPCTVATIFTCNRKTASRQAAAIVLNPRCSKL